MCLKNDYSTFKAVNFFSLSQTYSQIPLSWILFSIASTLFQDFFPGQTHISRISFYFLERRGSTIDSIYGLLLLSRAAQDKTVSKLLISSSLYIRTQE